MQEKDDWLQAKEFALAWLKSRKMKLRGNTKAANIARALKIKAEEKGTDSARSAVIDWHFSTITEALERMQKRH